MATSRTRKKTQDKTRKAAAQKNRENRQARFTQVLGSILEQVPVCTVCKGARTRITLAEVPLVSRQGVEEMCHDMQEAGLQVGELVYCSSCDQYSALSSWNSF